MLVLFRRTGEAILTDDGSKITILQAGRNRVKLGIEGPVKVVREEVKNRGEFQKKG
jgi:carbon storage regulator CsrA